jgi:hypothetical protein
MTSEALQDDLQPIARVLHLDDISFETQQRFWRKVERSGADDCWNWTGATNSRGYGSIGWGPKGKSKSWLTHRVSFVLAGGELDTSLTLDHTCRNKVCVNPAHLEQVSRCENIQRAAKTITHCRKGHPLYGANMRMSARGKRVCRTCAKAVSEKWNDKTRSLRRQRAHEQSSRRGGERPMG